MNYLNGGYVMLDKADSDIFAKASGALQAGKPILWYEDKNTCYFIDTIEKTGSDSIALTKGGLTIVVTSGNVVTELGSIQNHLYRHNIKLSFTGSDYSEEIGKDKDAETPISLSGTERCDIYFIIDNTSNEEITEYNDFDQYNGLTCNINIALTSKNYSGSSELKPNGNIGDKDYYAVRGLLTNSSYNIASIDIDLDSIGNDLTITDTVTQIF